MLRPMSAQFLRLGSSAFGLRRLAAAFSAACATNKMYFFIARCPHALSVSRFPFFFPALPFLVLSSRSQNVGPDFLFRAEL